MKHKTFYRVSLISLIFTISIALLSIIGIVITGLYPGIVVLTLVAMIPIASRLYARKISAGPDQFQRKYYRTFTFLNLLSILVVLWMTFVIVHDRILGDC